MKGASTDFNSVYLNKNKELIHVKLRNMKKEKTKHLWM